MTMSASPINSSDSLTKENIVTKQNYDDKRIRDIKPLISPNVLIQDLPLSYKARETIRQGRLFADKIIAAEDDRLLVVLGPCSIHDTRSALDYAQRLSQISQRFSSDLHLIMRVYFEKPRTTVGWKGLINDPHLDGTFAINKGLRIARSLLLQINELRVPVACEFLDMITPQYICDLVSWGAIGARTTESQIHRQLASGLSVPVGFKNGTDGNVQIAIDAILAARESHHFLGVTKQGQSAIFSTSGNDRCHVILRGGGTGPNYSREHVLSIHQQLESAGVISKVMIDCSHGNSEKNYRNQRRVALGIAEQLMSTGEQSTANAISGVMLESNIVEGRQDITSSDKMIYGQSVTDSCIGWEETVELLEILQNAVRTRRSNKFL